MNDYKKIHFDLSKAKTFENPNGLEVVTTNNYPVTIVSTNFRGRQWGYTILGIVHLKDEDHSYTFNEHGIIAQNYIFKESLYLKEPIKSRRMTRREFAWWLTECPEEHREWKKPEDDSIDAKDDMVYHSYEYIEAKENEPVEEHIVCRKNGGEWKEPLVEI